MKACLELGDKFPAIYGFERQL